MSTLLDAAVFVNEMGLFGRLLPGERMDSIVEFDLSSLELKVDNFADAT